MNGLFRKTPKLSEHYYSSSDKRTIVDIDKAKINRRKERWCKIAKEAAKQCMRMDIPEIAHVTTFESSLKMIKNNQLSIIPWEQEKGVPLKKL